MKKYVLHRFLQLIPVLIGITFLSFAMMRVAGSDAIIELYGDKGAVAQEILAQVLKNTGGYAPDDMTVLVAGIWES